MTASATATTSADFGGERTKRIETTTNVSTTAFSAVVMSSVARKPKNDGRRSASAMIAATGQNQRPRSGQCIFKNGGIHRSSQGQGDSVNGRHRTASTARIGYSATQENV